MRKIIFSFMLRSRLIFKENFEVLCVRGRRARHVTSLPREFIFSMKNRQYVERDVPRPPTPEDFCMLLLSLSLSLS